MAFFHLRGTNQHTQLLQVDPVLTS
jgi:hypothetical protein